MSSLDYGQLLGLSILPGSYRCEMIGLPGRPSESGLLHWGPP